MHLSEDDLILHYYGEAGGREAAAEQHLSACGACRGAFEALRRVMEAVDAAPEPEPGPSFERTVWARLAPQLEPGSPSRSWFNFGRLALAGGLAAIVLVVGALRTMTDATPPAATTVVDAETHRERVMLAAVSDHIEQSQVVLVELANADAESGVVDVSLERTAADDLVSSGRLYRETAIETGNMQLASLLEELEMVLVEIARGPEALWAEDLESIRRQIDTQELIFKLRVLGADVKARQQTQTPPTSQRTL